MADAVLFPLPVDIAECVPMAEEIGDLIDAALREVGAAIAGKWRYAGDAEIAKAQCLALDRFGVPYTMVTLDEYRSAMVAAHVPGRRTGLSAKQEWLVGTAA